MRARQCRDTHTDALEIDVADETSADDVRAAQMELAACLTLMVARLAGSNRPAIELTSVHGTHLEVNMGIVSEGG
jgi:hypothetical protein